MVIRSLSAPKRECNKLLSYMLHLRISLLSRLAFNLVKIIMETISREPTTVGVILLEEFIKPLNIKHEELGKFLNISPSHIKDIIFGNRRLSKDNKIKLAIFFKTDVDFWINIQSNHDIWKCKFKTSIRTVPDRKMKPLKYATAVENALRKKLDADVGYSRLICKNPNHSHWKIAVWQTELYTLGWLADSLDLSAANNKEIVANYGLGRNCTLFDKIHKWAYRTIR
jgi:addiction module HigA family antidote